MDTETRTAFALLEARMDRWFGLSQAQHIELRQAMDAGFAAVDRQFGAVDTQFAAVATQFAEMRRDIQRVDTTLSALHDEFRSFRDWVVEQFADLRAAIRQLTHRLERLEQDRSDLP